VVTFVTSSGTFFMARLFGVRVDVFSFGFARGCSASTTAR